MHGAWNDFPRVLVLIDLDSFLNEITHGVRNEINTRHVCLGLSKHGRIGSLLFIQPVIPLLVDRLGRYDLLLP